MLESPHQEEPKPDVLLVVIDTLRADRLGAYGYTRGLTPVMDELARKGSVFRRASSQAAWTLPSMCSLVTSQYPTRSNHFPHPGRTTLAEAFQAGGYATVGVVANDILDPLNEPLGGFERGFDAYVPRTGPDGKRRGPAHFDAVASWAEEALQAAVTPDENGLRKPLFFYIHPSDPHTPYHGKQRMLADQPLGTVPPILPEGWQLQQLMERGPSAPADDPHWEKALHTMQRVRNAYDHEVRTADEALGRLLDHLRDLGVGDNLIVAIVSDHGEELFENVLLGKPEELRDMDPRAFFFQTHGYSLYEQELRTPFILSGPGITQGRVFDEPVENVDLLPTLVSLCGLKRPEDPHGVDLTTLMEGRADPEQWRSLTYSWVGQAISVRDEARGLKLVLPTPFGMERNLLAPQLFDLHADPLERVNLWPSRREDGQRLASEIIAYLERYKARPFLLTGKALEELNEGLRAMGYADAAVGLPSDGEPEAAKMKRMLLERGYLQE